MIQIRKHLENLGLGFMLADKQTARQTVPESTKEIGDRFAPSSKLPSHIAARTSAINAACSGMAKQFGFVRPRATELGESKDGSIYVSVVDDEIRTSLGKEGPFSKKSHVRLCGTAKVSPEGKVELLGRSSVPYYERFEFEEKDSNPRRILSSAKVDFPPVHELPAQARAVLAAKAAVIEAAASTDHPAAPYHDYYDWVASLDVQRIIPNDDGGHTVVLLEGMSRALAQRINGRYERYNSGTSYAIQVAADGTATVESINRFRSDEREI